MFMSNTAILLFMTIAATAHGFAINTSQSTLLALPTMKRRNNYYYKHKNTMNQLYAKGRSSSSSSSSSSEDDANDNTDADELVTKEMFLRGMIDGGTNEESKENHEPKEGKVKRKKRNGKHYRVLDNRDNLPFLVKVTTPDPYTNNEIMQKKARKNTENFAKGTKSKNNKKSKDMKSKRHNLIGMDGVDSIASSIYMRKKDGTLDQVLGEFKLDKSTNCGDIIDVGGGIEYQVQKARCQYKYVGGKKFVMTRKILEVKEVKRLLVEKEVKQLFEKDGSSSEDNDILGLE